MKVKSFKLLSLIYFDFGLINCIEIEPLSSCGIDNSPISEVYEGYAQIRHYPWMGYLLFPIGQKQFTTAVVLVSRQIVIAAASEIDRLPKDNFRKLAKVVLGINCNGPKIDVKEYTYHPEYRRNLYNNIALIQLDIDMISQELKPICPPPTHFINPQFYAITVGEDCKDSKIQIYRMKFVSTKACRRYYRRNGIDMNLMWPRYTACARAVTAKKECIWRSGTALVMKQGDRWLLLGFGVYGPGCSSPARFVDYGKYHDWVKRSLLRIGRPAITRMGPSQIVMRKTRSALQRFGACDPEEVTTEIFSDQTEINMPYADESEGAEMKAIYNITLHTNVEYSCVVFRVNDFEVSEKNYNYPPSIHLKRWCAGSKAMCYDYQFLQIDFYVEIFYRNSVMFKVVAYGQQPKIIDPMRVYEHLNEYIPFPEIPEELDLKFDFPWYSSN